MRHTRSSSTHSMPIGVPQLPSCLSNATLKDFRLSCRDANNLTTLYLFRTLRFELTESGCHALNKVAGCPALAPCVENLVLQKTAGQPDREKASKWRWALDLPGCPPGRFAHLPRSSKSLVDDRGLLTHSGWLALPFHDEEALYREYESARKQQDRHLQRLTCIPGCAWARSIGQGEPSAGPADDNIIRTFHQALETLTNLVAFSHQPGWRFDKNWGCRWRILRFSHAAVRRQTRVGKDEDAEALRLSNALHAIGQASSLHRLKRISFSIYGPAFWGSERLRALWNGSGCAAIRYLRDVLGTAVEADRTISRSVYEDERDGQW